MGVAQRLEHRTVDPKVGGSIPLTHPTQLSPVTPRDSSSYEDKGRKFPFHRFPSFSAVFCLNPARKSRPSSGAARGRGRLRHPRTGPIQASGAASDDHGSPAGSLAGPLRKGWPGSVGIIAAGNPLNKRLPAPLEAPSSQGGYGAVARLERRPAIVNLYRNLPYFFTKGPRSAFDFPCVSAIL